FQVAQLAITGTDLFLVLSFLGVDRAAATKVNVVAHAVSVVDRHVRMDRVAFGIALHSAGRNKAVAGQNDIGDSQVDGCGIDLAAGKHTHAVVHLDAFERGGRVRRVERAVPPAARPLTGKIFVQEGKMGRVAFALEAL